jgi:dUTP pyrophosphatase
MYQLNIKLNSDLSPAIKSYYRQYAMKYEGDSGIDLPVPNDMNIYNNTLETINFGISCSMINLKENKQASYFLFPRSSISSTGLYLANSTGIIDSGYRGNIMAKIRYTPISNSASATVLTFNPFKLIKSSLNILYLWLMSFFYSKKIFVKEGTRLFQICAPGLESIKLKIVDLLDETERGDRGFGSTGI